MVHKTFQTAFIISFKRSGQHDLERKGLHFGVLVDVTRTGTKTVAQITNAT